MDRRSGERLRVGSGESSCRRFSGLDATVDPPSKRDGLRDVPRLDFLWWLRGGEGLRLFLRLTDEGERCVPLRLGLSEPRVSSNSRPLFRSLTSSLESRTGDLDTLRLRSWLRSRARSVCCDRGLDLPGLLSLAGLESLSLSGRRAMGDGDLLGRVTPRSTLPRSLRSSA